MKGELQRVRYLSTPYKLSIRIKGRVSREGAPQHCQASTNLPYGQIPYITLGGSKDYLYLSLRDT